MKVALYARVSTEKQAEKDIPISGQLKALRKYCKDRGLTIVKEFVDEGESARSDKRPAFQEMIAHAKQKNKIFDAIVVWKLSRFARNREDSVIYKMLLRKQGVDVISMNEQIDDSPSGKLLEGIIESIDEFYSANLSQDTIRGLKENARRGFRNGGTAPTGYKNKKVKDGNNERIKLEPDPTYSPIVKRIFKMCLKGIGAKEIAKNLNQEGLVTTHGKPWSKNRVLYILKNETYTGTSVWRTHNRSNRLGKSKDGDDLIRIKNTHVPLIDKKDYERVQVLIHERSPKITKPRTINSKYILSGLIFCGECGLSMIGTAAKTSHYYYYSCQNYCKRGKSVCAAKPVCKSRIEDFVIDRLKEHILTEENLEELIKLTNEELNRSDEESLEKLKTIEGQLTQLNSRLERLFDSLETGKISIETISPRIEKLKENIESLENEKMNLEMSHRSSTVKELDPKVIKAHARDLKNLLGQGTIIEQRSFIKSFVKRIVVNRENIEIEYTIPIQKEKVEPVNREVLPIASIGSATRT